MPMYRNSITWTAMFGVIALMFVKLPPMVAKQDSVINTYSRPGRSRMRWPRQRFVTAITDDRLVEGAIRGMMRQLDPYSGYISPKSCRDFSDAIAASTAAWDWKSASRRSHGHHRPHRRQLGRSGRNPGGRPAPEHRREGRRTPFHV